MFERRQLGKHSLGEKYELGKLCRKYKNKYDNLVEENRDKPSYASKFYEHLRDAKHDNPNVVKALKLGKQCIQSIETSETELLAPPTNSRTAL